MFSSPIKKVVSSCGAALGILALLLPMKPQSAQAQPADSWSAAAQSHQVTLDPVVMTTVSRDVNFNQDNVLKVKSVSEAQDYPSVEAAAKWDRTALLRFNTKGIQGKILDAHLYLTGSISKDANLRQYEPPEVTTTSVFAASTWPEPLSFGLPPYSWGQQLGSASVERNLQDGRSRRFDINGTLMVEAVVQTQRIHLGWVGFVLNNINGTPHAISVFTSPQLVLTVEGADPNPTATPKPTPHPTATPTPKPQPLRVQIIPSATDICAGGWDQGFNGGKGGYGYLSKEKSDAKDPHPWVARNREVGSKDPHVVTLTATVTGGTGNLAGRTVTFNCDMPGPDPSQTPSAVTNTQGVAQVTITSGDELSRDTDYTGKQLFNEPVPVQVDCTVGKEHVNKALLFNVLAPSVKWKYKDDQGNYSDWNGKLYDLYEKPSYHNGIPLQAVLTFNKIPVVGHHISWGISHVYDKAGAEVPSSNANYRTYGQMSGAISTTTYAGTATADFKYGYSFGRLVFDITDASVFTSDGLASEMSIKSSGHAHRDKNKKLYYTTDPLSQYDYVKGKPTSIDGLPDDSRANSHAYPAPSGEEDGGPADEILPPTLNLVRGIMSESVGRESQTGSRVQTPGKDIIDARNGDRYLQNGYWWFSQCVGNDAESSGTHLADLKIRFLDPNTGQVKFHYFSGAFDIVLTKVPIFKHVGRVALFGPPLKAMRDQGIVAWHRWAGETGTTSENEMHCIDPSTPYLKNYLQFQIGEFLRSDGQGTGGRGYTPDPDPKKPYLAFWADFHIDPIQQDRVGWRRAHLYDKVGMERDNIKP